MEKIGEECRQMEVSRQRKAYLYWKANKENIRQRIITNFNLDKDWKGIK